MSRKTLATLAFTFLAIISFNALFALFSSQSWLPDRINTPTITELTQEEENEVSVLKRVDSCDKTISICEDNSNQMPENASISQLPELAMVEYDEIDSPSTVISDTDDSQTESLPINNPSENGNTFPVTTNESLENVSPPIGEPIPFDDGADIQPSFDIYEAAEKARNAIQTNDEGQLIAEQEQQTAVFSTAGVQMLLLVPATVSNERSNTVGQFSGVQFDKGRRGKPSVASLPDSTVQTVAIQASETPTNTTQIPSPSTPVTNTATTEESYEFNVSLATLFIADTALTNVPINDQPEVEENVVRWLHENNISEEFIARDEGIEQRWWIEEDPNLTGEIRVQVFIETELMLVENGGDFFFHEVNENGELGQAIALYSRAIAIDANGEKWWSAGIATEVTNENGQRVGYTLNMTFPIEYVSQVQYPLLIDPLISNVTRIGHEPAFQDQSGARVAYNNNDNEYLVVWQDTRNSAGYDVYGQLFGGNGDLIGENISIATGSLDQKLPRVSYGNGYYFVAWADQTTSGSNYSDAKGQFLTADGLLHGSVVTIDNGGGYDSEAPREIVYNSTHDEFFVLWHDLGSAYWNIWGRHVDASGTLGSKIQITFLNSKHESHPIAAYNPISDEYLVAWKYRNISSGTGDVRARRVGADGTVNSSETINIATGGADQFASGIAYFADAQQYMIVWRDDRNGATNGNDIYGQFVDTSGSLINGNFVIANTVANESAVKISEDGTFVIWQTDTGNGGPHDMYLQRFDNIGQKQGSHINLSDSDGDYRSINIALASNGFLATWNNTQSGNDNVYGGFFTADGIALDNGQMLHPALSDQTKLDLAYNPDDDEYLLVWQDGRNGTDYDVYGQWLDGNGNLIGDNIVIVSDVLDQKEAHVAYGNGKYLVVWRHNVYGSHPNSADVFGQFLSPVTKQLDGGVITIEDGSAYADVESPTDLIYNPTADKFFVVWQDLSQGMWNIWGAHVLQSGVVENKRKLSSANSIHEYAGRATYNSFNDEYLVVWYQKRSSSNRDVYARRMSSQGTVYGSSAIAISTDSLNEASAKAIYLSEVDQYLVTWHDNNGSNDTNIRGQLLTATGALHGSAYTIGSTVGSDVHPNLFTYKDGRYTVFWSKDRNVYQILLGNAGQPLWQDHLILNRELDATYINIVKNADDNFLIGWSESGDNSDNYIVMADIPWVELEISKAGPAQATANQPFTYNLTITNTGNITATNVVITDLLPSGVNYLNGGALINGATVQWSLAELAPNTPVTVSFDVVAETATTVVNDHYGATADGGFSVMDQKPVTTTVSPSSIETPLTITKIAPAAVSDGASIPYTITVQNTGQLTATNLIITDVLPLNAGFVSSSNSATPTNGVLTWNVPELAPAASIDVSFVVTAAQSIVNSDYGVTADGGINATGQTPVFTRVGESLADGNWWNQEWFYRRAITVTGTVAESPYNTAAFTFDTAALIDAGKLQPDGRDLRMTYVDDTGWHLLPMQLSSEVTPTATITFSLPTGIPSDAEYYLYYGNQIAGYGPRFDALDLTAADVITDLVGTSTITPTINFYSTQRSAWTGESITFTSLISPTSVPDITWGFGDSVTTTGAIVSHTYQVAGIYPVTVTVTMTDTSEHTFGYDNYLTVFQDVTNNLTIAVGAERTPVITKTIDTTVGGTVTSAQGDLAVIVEPSGTSQNLSITHTPHQAEVVQAADTLNRFELNAIDTDTGTSITAFTSPVTMEFDLIAAGIDVGDWAGTALFYWNESSEQWDRVAIAVDVQTGIATASLAQAGHYVAKKDGGVGQPPRMVQTPSVDGSGVDLLTGSSTYAYPINVPPGTNGMQPNLSLVYNSGTADTLMNEQGGIVGHGFELAGLGMIQYDNESSNYYITLNGVYEPIVPVVGGNNEYSIPQKPQWRAEYIENGFNGINNVPYDNETGAFFPNTGPIRGGWWLITTEDGTKYQFGSNKTSSNYILNSSVGSRLVYRYSLDHVQDIYGNTMVITYEEEERNADQSDFFDDDPRPTEIRYTSNVSENLQGTRLLKFSYSLPASPYKNTIYDGEDEIDVRADYPVGNFITGQTGFVLGYKEALVSIEIFESITPSNLGQLSSKVRSYEFEYEYYTQDGDIPSLQGIGLIDGYGPSHYHLMLKDIAVHGSDGSNLTSLSQTSFTYAPTGHLATISNQNGASIEYTYEPVVYETGEINFYRITNVVNGFPISEIDLGSRTYGKEPEADRWRVNTRSIVDQDIQGAVIQENTYIYDYAPAVNVRYMFGDDTFYGHPVVETNLPTGDSVVSYISLGNVEVASNPYSNGNNTNRSSRFHGQVLESSVMDNNANGSVPLSVSTYDYKYDTQSSAFFLGCEATVTRGVVVTTGTETKTCYDYDNYGNVTHVWEYGDTNDVGDGRVTVFEYAYDLTNNVLNLPAETRVSSFNDSPLVGSTSIQPQEGTPLARTTYTYVSTNGAPETLTITQHDLANYTNVNSEYGLALTETENQVTVFELDGFGNVVLTRENNSETTTRYDPYHFSFPEVITYPEGLTEEYEYNYGLGVVTSHTDLNGYTTNWSHDEYGRVIGEVGANGVTCYAYSNTLSQVTVTRYGDATTDCSNLPIGNFPSVTYTYNGLSQLRSIMQRQYDSDGNELPHVFTTFSYDQLGRLQSKTLPFNSGDVVDYESNIAYDALGRPVSVQDTDGTTTFNYAYWPAVTENRYTTNQVSTYYVDAYGRIDRVLEQLTYPNDPPEWIQTNYSYDLLGNLTHVTDNDGNLTRMAYDSFGNKRFLADPNQVSSDPTISPYWIYNYNSNGLLANQTDPRGIQTIFTYDDLGRLELKQYDTSLNDTAFCTNTIYCVPTANDVEYYYDGQYLLQRVVQDKTIGTTTATWQYDEAGRVIRETETITSLATNDVHTYGTAYSYDAFGRLATMMYPDGETVTYEYNDLDQIVSMTGLTDYLSNVVYKPNGQPELREFGRMLTQEIVYNSVNQRPQNVTLSFFDDNGTTPLDEISGILYNEFGSLESVNHQSQGNYAYAYDSLNRLTSIEETVGHTSQPYDYDGLGNLLSRATNQPAPVTFDYGDSTDPDHLPHLPEEGVGPDGNQWDYVYDNGGNLVKKTQRDSTPSIYTEYTYDVENRLVEIKEHDGSTTVTTQYVYDGMGQRVIEYVFEGSTEDETFYMGEIASLKAEDDNNLLAIDITSNVVYEQMVFGTNNDVYLVGDNNRNDASDAGFRRLDGTETIWISPNGGFNADIAIDSNGILHIVMDGYDRGKLFYTYSKDKGITWEEQVEVKADENTVPTILIDSNDRINIVYTDEGTVIHSYRDELPVVGDSWEEKTISNTQFTESNVNRNYVAFLNSDDRIHLLGENNGNLYHLTKSTNGNWPATVPPEINGSALLPSDHAMQHAVDPLTNDIHVVWRDTTGVRYQRWDNASSTWESTTATIPNANVYAPDIVVDAQGQLHITWFEDTGSSTPDEVAYCYVNDIANCTGADVDRYPDYETSQLVYGESGVFLLAKNAGGWRYNYQPDNTATSFVDLAIGDNINAVETDGAAGLHIISGDTYYHLTPYATTKNYFVGGERIAVRQSDNELHYTISDPTGTSTMIVDSAGNNVAQLIYDGFGSVLYQEGDTQVINTVMRNGSALAAGGSGLVHLGNGRYYNPLLGRPLQPDPYGAPLVMPQAQNRYTATSSGQPGVYASGSAKFESIFDRLAFFGCCSPLDIANDYAAELSVEAAGSYIPAQRVRVTQPSGTRALSRYNPDRINRNISISLRADGTYAREVSASLSASRARMELGYLDEGLNAGILSYNTSPRQFTPLSSRLLGIERGKFSQADLVLGSGAGFIFDAGFQFLQDAGNPYLSPAAKIFRPLISGGVGLGTGIVVTSLIGGGVPGFVLGVGIGWIIEAPVTNRIFKTIGFIENRELFPLP